MNPLMSRQNKGTVGTINLLTATEAAEYLGFGDHKAPTEAVRYLCRCRKLKFVKVGRGLRFRREWLDQFIEREAVEPVRL